MKNKLKRTLSSFLPINEGRTGSCNHCGACCQLPYRCVFLRTADDNKEYCAIYAIRPPNCRKFPRTAEEYELVKDVCGFAFDKMKKTPP